MSSFTDPRGPGQPTITQDELRAVLCAIGQLADGVCSQVRHANAAMEAGEGQPPAPDDLQRVADRASALAHELMTLSRRIAAQHSPEPAPKPRGRTRVIVVAEDDSLVAELTERILGRAGYRVLVATDGMSALELIRQEGPTVELLVSDIVMPEMNGLELVKVLSGERPALPVLLVSGHPEDERRLSDQVLATTPFLPKPFKAAELLAAIETLLSRPTIDV